MPALLAEGLGLLLWRSDRAGVAFVGAMLAVGATGVSAWLSWRWLLREKRR